MVWRLCVFMFLMVTGTITHQLEAQSCDFYEGAVSFASEGGNQNSSYQSKYFLVDPADGTILYISDIPSFDNVAAGNYEIVAINYNTRYRVIGLRVNSNVSDIKSLCPPDMSEPLQLRVCSVPKIVAKGDTLVDVCMDDPRYPAGPDMLFTEEDGDSLELHITISSGGDPTHDSLHVDLAAFSNAIKSYNFPTLIISAANGTGGGGVAPIDAQAILRTLTLTGGSPHEGMRTITIQAFDPQGGGSNIAEIYFNGMNCTDCSSLIALRTDQRFQEDCASTYDYCLSIHRDSLYRYNIVDNGMLVDQLAICSPDTTVYYSYSSIANEDGPFDVTIWDIGDRSFSANFDNFDQLAMYMEAWDVIGHWANNSGLSIIEGPSIRKSYGGLDITQVATGKSWTIDPDRRIQSNDFTAIPLTVGSHELIILDTILMCYDTLDVTIVCDDAVEYVSAFLSLYDTVQVGQTDMICLDQPGIEVVGIYNECLPSSGEYVRFDTEASCITYAGIEVGLDSFCVVACGPIGDCDTTTFYVNVIPEITSPIAIDDTASTVETVPVFIDIMANDELSEGTLKDIFILDGPDFGTVDIDRQNDVLAEYVPRDNFCGWIDSFTYVIVNEFSQDTATVLVDIHCDSLRVLNGFSPNGDGINDVFVILGIEDIEKNRVRAYNRWGNQVLSVENYTNQEGWDGTWKGSDLPSGTYFYTVEDRARRIIRSGWVQIYRG